MGRYGAGDVAFFDELARVYDLAMPGTDGAELARALEAAERPVERVFDVAGGTGRGVAAVDAETRVVCDVSWGMLARVGNRDPEIHAVAGDAERLPVPDDAVDAVIVVDALHHVPDREAAIRECARVLAPGGVLVVRDFDPTRLAGQLVAAGEHLVGMDSAFESPATTARRVEAAGLEATHRSDWLAYTLVGVAPKGENH